MKEMVWCYMATVVEARYKIETYTRNHKDRHRWPSGESARNPVGRLVVQAHTVSYQRH